MNTNVLVTSDIHFEKLNIEKIDSYVDYISRAIMSVKPAMFIIAGDTTDSRTLQVGSLEYLMLQKFLLLIEDSCNKVGTSFVILKGTPAHDGSVLKNVTSTILRSTIYIDDICVKKINGIEALFIPQTYGTLEGFEATVKNVVGTKKPTFGVFHGMFDFAIPNYQSTDSQFNLSRDICMRAEFMQEMVTHFMVGGHVHEYIKHGDIFYCGKFCNTSGTPVRKEIDYGIKRFCIRDDGYNMHPILNPHLEDVQEVRYEINHDTNIEQIIGNAMKFSTINTVFVLITDMSAEANQAVMDFKRVVKPIHMKRKINAKIANDANKLLNSVLDSSESEKVETEELLKSMYEKKYKTKLPDKILQNIVGA